ncbi:MAG: ATP-binding cassette domain-containing protein [Bacilli bacterium]
MLRLKNITKEYLVADTKVQALKGISLSFRANEFVSILGPSGCGKTTTLNIIGGLDHYTDGDLFINGISTKNFKDKDWDVYRNHRVGFIFQSYNLIPHQTILENVELALTISGMGKEERIAKAKKMLDKVGLSDQYNKKPNQLSGGQCQRVAIARALVNDPEILLADEPTGALDTVTSVQIMELIQEIAKERLVIMVTHNPELAEKYSTRIIRLVDGLVTDDSNPFDEEKEIEECRKIQEETNKEGMIKKEKAKMSFMQALKLSGRNLISKFKRTLMVCLAGSIGIIGVSTVLSVSSGVKGYITSMQDDMLSGNPVQISEQGYDLSKMVSSMTQAQKNQAVKENTKDGYVNVESLVAYIVNMSNAKDSIMVTNEITKDYVDFIMEMPEEYRADILLDYGIDLTNNIYTDFQVEKGNNETNYNPSISVLKQTYTSVLEKTQYADFATYITSLATPFAQATSNEEYILQQYDIISSEEKSHIAKEKNEIMIVVSNETKLQDVLLAELGYYTEDEFLNICWKETDDEKYNKDLDKTSFSYDELLNKKFTYYPNDAIYKENVYSELNPYSDTNPFTYTAYADELDDSEAIELEVTAILRPKKDVMYGCLQSGFYYTEALTEYVREDANESRIVKRIDEINERNKDKENYQEKTGYSSMWATTTVGGMEVEVPIGITYKYDYYYVKGGTQGKVELEKVEDEIGFVGSSSTMLDMLGSMGLPITNPHTITRRELGGCNVPSNISVYPVDFKIKDKVTSYLDKWNQEGDITLSDGRVITQQSRNDITYTDNLEVVINMIGSMIDIITYALVAFTAISLVVSTVMIGIITYVSVVERIKEIGVIRSLGGRKKDVKHLFNAETFIIGLCSGILGIAITYGISGIINLIVGSLTGIYTIASLPVSSAIIMIIVSILLTLISGLIPASSAAKKDPVIALRTE